MGNLDDILGKLPDLTGMTGTVDVSDMFKEPAGTSVFTYRDLSAKAMFAAREDAARLRLTHPDWPPALAMTVLILAQSHLTPTLAPDKSAAEYYCEIAEKSAVLLERLNNGFSEAFPHIALMQKEAEKREKPSAAV